MSHVDDTTWKVLPQDLKKLIIKARKDEATKKEESQDTTPMQTAKANVVDTVEVEEELEDIISNMSEEQRAALEMFLEESDEEDSVNGEALGFMTKIEPITEEEDTPQVTQPDEEISQPSPEPTQDSHSTASYSPEIYYGDSPPDHQDLKYIRSLDFFWRENDGIPSPD